MTEQQNDETNNRIFSRNIPSNQLQSYIDIKPTSTKRCSVFPTVDIRQPNPAVFPTYDPVKTFNPGNRKAPWSGFSNKIGDESILRGQIFPLQRSNNETTYVPSSTSDLYTSFYDENIQGGQQPFPLLFKNDVPIPAIIPKPTDPHVFGNHTRQQLE